MSFDIMRRRANPIGGADIWREARASYAFVLRNFFLVKRYWGWEVAFVIFTVSSSMSVLYIGKAQGGDGSDLILYLGIGTIVWSYLREVFGGISEMIVWERWEGTIEYTMMAPISRLTHMLGVSLFSVGYAFVRTSVLFLVLSLFFDVDLGNANLTGATIVILLGSLSFIGFGILAAVLPLLFPEKGEQMSFVISSVLLLVSGVYYPVDVLPGWMQGMARVSPATYVLEGMRATILDGEATSDIGGYLWRIGLIGLLAIPIGVGVFMWAEHYAKRSGRLKRSG